MPEIINCPQCERKLRVPDDLLDRPVKCPTCGHLFTAPPGSAEVATAVPAADALQTPPSYAESEPLRQTSSSPLAGEPEFPGEAYRETVAHRRPSRPYLQPHRGPLILVLGILSICVFGFLGPVAWIMGNSDLR